MHFFWVYLVGYALIWYGYVCFFLLCCFFCYAFFCVAKQKKNFMSLAKNTHTHLRHTSTYTLCNLLENSHSHCHCYLGILPSLHSCHHILESFHFSPNYIMKLIPMLLTLYVIHSMFFFFNCVFVFFFSVFDCLKQNIKQASKINNKNDKT